LYEYLSVRYFPQNIKCGQFPKSFKTSQKLTALSVFSKMLMLSESTIIAGVDKSNGKVVLLPVRVPNKK